MVKALAALIAAVSLAAPAAAQQPCGNSGLLVNVTPANPKIGDTITVTISNPTNTQFNLPNSCVFQGVHPTDCTQPAVTNLICLQVITPIPPGSSKSLTWNQQDDFGQQVPAGTYAFDINYFGPAGQDGCCPQVTISDPCPAPVHYGQGSAGSGLCTPQLTASGLPQIGNAAFQLQVSNALGGALAGIFANAQPANLVTGWGTFLVDPNPPILQALFGLGGPSGAPCQGTGVLPAPIPNQAILIGTSAYVQVLVSDPGSIGGIASTDGLQITLCGP